MPQDTPLTDRYDRALQYARSHHATQLRKGTDIPYFAHVMAVSGLVLEMGGSEDEAIAGLLHDVVEDGGGEAAIAEIRERFGPDVLEMVLANSDTTVEPKPPWLQRKTAYIEGIATKSPGAQRVSLADKLHNARAILLDYRTHGEELWARFKAGEGESVRWYYRALHDAFVRRADALGHDAAPILDELGRTLDELDRLTALAAGRVPADEVPRLYLNVMSSLDWLVALEFGRVDDGQPGDAWEVLAPDCGILVDLGRPVGFKVLDYSTYDPYDEEHEAAWSGPRFHVPQLGLREATANEIVLATRALYGTENSVNRDYFGAAANESGEEALALWLGCLQAGDSMAHFALGYTLLELGRPHEAYRHLRYYTDLAPGIAWNWIWRGHAARALGYLEEARLAYTAALELDDEDETDAEALRAERG